MGPRPPRVAALLAVAALLGGCAETRHAWVPTNAPSSTPGMTQVPTADYPIPAEAPAGRLQVTSLGVRELRREDNEKRRVLVVRLRVQNDSAAPWQVDVAQQQVVFANGERVQPALASSDRQLGRTTQVATVPPHDAETLQLLFPVSSDQESQAFTFEWQVQAGTRLAAGRTDFRPIEIEEPDEREAEAVYVGPGAEVYFGYPFYYTPYFAPFVFSFGVPLYWGPYGGWRYPYYYGGRPYYRQPYYRPYPGPRVVPPPPAFHGGGGARMIPPPRFGPHGIPPPRPPAVARPPTLGRPPAFHGGARMAPPPAFHGGARMAPPPAFHGGARMAPPRAGGGRPR